VSPELKSKQNKKHTTREQFDSEIEIELEHGRRGEAGRRKRAENIPREGKR
jgi:hypothetical protein